MATTTQETRPQQAVEQAMGEARSLADEAKRTTADLGRDARQQLRAQADEQTARVAGSLHQLATQFDQMGAAGGPGLPSDLVRDASTRLEGMATRLDREGLESILADAKRFARNRPGTFLLIAAAAGAAAARLLKATDTERLKEAVTGGDASGNGGPTGRGSVPDDQPEIDLTGSPTTAPAGLTSAPTGEWVGP
jgi:hypothetical protein